MFVSLSIFGCVPGAGAGAGAGASSTNNLSFSAVISVINFSDVVVLINASLIASLYAVFNASLNSTKVDICYYIH